MTMLILAICVGMCQIDIYWGLGTGEDEGAVNLSAMSKLNFMRSPPETWEWFYVEVRLDKKSVISSYYNF